MKSFIPLCIVKNAHRLKLITGGTSILLAPVGSTVIRDQTVTKIVLDHENKTIFFLQIQRNFTWSNNGGTDTFLRANICATDTGYCYISG